jgi:hypothetical protein
MTRLSTPTPPYRPTSTPLSALAPPSTRSDSPTTAQSRYQVRKEGRSRSLLGNEAQCHQGQPPLREEAQELRNWFVQTSNYSRLALTLLPPPGQSIQPTTDLTRFVKWPEYVRLQRQKVILNQRLKVPPAIAQFSKVLDKNTAVQLFRLLNKYKGETKAEKKVRLEARAAEIAEGKKSDEGKKPFFVKSGLNVRSPPSPPPEHLY